MDEAEMYKQRLEAIAEKLQLQEEQERVKREMGEERLRLQQLKRKSLRDQWLMEGAPLSPASSDTQSPRSPLWGSEAQEMKEHIDQHSCGLQSESQQLTVEEEEEPMENKKMVPTPQHKVHRSSCSRCNSSLIPLTQQEAAKMEDAGTESRGDGVCTNQSLLPDKTAMISSNDRGEGATSPDCSDNNQSSSMASASGDGLRVGLSEGKPAPNPSFSVEEEETVAMIAEHGIEEEDEEPEAMEGLLKGVQSETDPERQGAEGEEIKREAAGEKHQTTQHAAETTPPPAAEQETKAPAAPLGVTVVSTVPIYSQPKSASEQEADGSAAAASEGADNSSESKETPALPGQFQEVFLVDPQNDKWMEGMPGEEDSLLPQAKAPDSHTEPEVGERSASTETRSPTRASRKERSKTGLCCTVM